MDVRNDAMTDRRYREDWIEDRGYEERKEGMRSRFGGAMEADKDEMGNGKGEDRRKATGGGMKLQKHPK